MISDLIKSTPKKLNIDVEGLKDLLFKNGVKNYLYTPSSSYNPSGGDPCHTKETIASKIIKLGEEYNFEIKQEQSFAFFYVLCETVLDAGYIYAPGFESYFLMPNPKLEKITNVSKGLTKLFPFPLIGVYEGDLFAIPKITLYKNGELLRASRNAGIEPYNPYYSNLSKVLDNFSKLLELERLGSLDEVR